MSDGARITVQGMQSFTAMAQNLSDAIIEGIDDELEAAAFDMRAIADTLITDNGTINTAYLKSRLQVIPVQGNHRALFINDAFYAPFVEFGTGPRVNVPGEWADYAAQFKGMKNGDKTDFIRNIKEWIGNKQIAVPAGYTLDSFAERIVLSILQKGLKPRPFMYPAYRKIADELPRRIAVRLNDATR